MGIRDHDTVKSSLNRKQILSMAASVGLIIIVIIVGNSALKSKVDESTFLGEPSSQEEGPRRRNSAEDTLDIQARAAISVFVDSNGGEHVLIEKNSEERFPIASVTKLMTALVASEIFGPDEVITISESVLAKKGASSQYSAEDSFIFIDALHAILISSHNEMAMAVAEKASENIFVQKMNDRAHALGLADTHFVNPTGLDPDTGSEAINYSTASDIYKLLKYIFENRADIFSILEKDTYQFTDTTGTRVFTIETTNKLLGDREVGLNVLGGKTGETPIARQNLAVVSVAPSRGRVISVVIGSENSFGEMRDLLGYIKTSFVW